MKADKKAKIQSWQPLFFQYGVYDFMILLAAVVDLILDLLVKKEHLV